MRDEKSTKKQLMQELEEMRQKVAELQVVESEQKRIAEALRQSENMFRKITEKSIVGVYLIQDYVFRYINPKMAEIFGYTVDELVDIRGPEDVVHDEDWPMVEENLRKRIAGEMESINYQFRGKTKTGAIVHHEVYGSRTEYNGKPAVIGTMLDISHRVRAERDLETQLKRFQALYHLAVAMTAERTLEENLRLLVEKSRELLEADTSFIAVFDENTDQMPIRAYSGATLKELKRLSELFVSMNPLNSALLHQEIGQENLFNKLNVGEKNKGSKILVSGIAVPLRIKEEELGVLWIGNRENSSFTESQKELLTLLGSMAALEITRKKDEEALAQSEKQLRLLSSQLLSAQEVERKRVAQELHDGIGQVLTGLKFEVEDIIRKTPDRVPKKHISLLESLIPKIQKIVEEVGRIAMDLRPSILDDLGLHATTAWLCRDFQRMHPQIVFKTELELEETEITEYRKVVIFRVLQEALNNVVKHSHADLVHVHLGKQDGHVHLTVRDNGIGFHWDSTDPMNGQRRGFGLTSMKERTQLSGGSLKIRSSKGNGTSITATWPVKHA